MGLSVRDRDTALSQGNDGCDAGQAGQMGPDGHRTGPVMCVTGQRIVDPKNK